MHEAIVSISELDFKYKDTKIFDKISLSINNNSWNTLIGDNSGKSTLLELINKGHENIIYNNPVNNTKKIKIVLLTKYYRFKKTKVLSEFDQYNSIVGTPNFKYVTKLLGLIDNNDILNQKIANLDVADRQILALAVALYRIPNLIMLDNALSYVDRNRKNKVFKILKGYKKANKTTIINVSTDPEDLLLSDRIIIMNKGKIVFSGGKQQVLENEKIFKKNNLIRPFIVELSSKLKYYELTEGIYTNEDKLVNDIWK